MRSRIVHKLIHSDKLYIIGLNSGTSSDGLDIVLARFAALKKPEILECHTYPYPDSLKQMIIDFGEPDFRDGEKWLALDTELGITMGEMAKKFIKSRKITKVDLIGSHGQTIRHLPKEYGKPLTLQIGDESQIARICGVPVVSDFRRTDIAAGGEGAPMSPIIHEALFRDKDKWRAIINIGGIANITILPPLNSTRRPIAGDSGPGNMAVDLAIRSLTGQPYDLNGRIALKGRANSDYVLKVLKSPYFQAKPPKSTGRELFGMKFAKKVMGDLKNQSIEYIVATLSEITVASIAHFILKYSSNMNEIYICGGGAKNRYFLNRLRMIFKGNIVESTALLGYDPDYLEALLWAYLANNFINEYQVDAKRFTGADKRYIPGKICLP